MIRKILAATGLSMLAISGVVAVYYLNHQSLDLRQQASVKNGVVTLKLSPPTEGFVDQPLFFSLSLETSGANVQEINVVGDFNGPITSVSFAVDGATSTQLQLSKQSISTKSVHLTFSPANGQAFQTASGQQAALGTFTVLASAPATISFNWDEKATTALLAGSGEDSLNRPDRSSVKITRSGENQADTTPEQPTEVATSISPPEPTKQTPLPTATVPSIQTTTSSPNPVSTTTTATHQPPPTSDSNNQLPSPTPQTATQTNTTAPMTPIPTNNSSNQAPATTTTNQNSALGNLLNSGTTEQQPNQTNNTGAPTPTTPTAPSSLQTATQTSTTNHIAQAPQQPPTSGAKANTSPLTDTNTAPNSSTPPNFSTTGSGAVTTTSPNQDSPIRKALRAFHSLPLPAQMGIAALAGLGIAGGRVAGYFWLTGKLAAEQVGSIVSGSSSLSTTPSTQTATPTETPPQASPPQTGPLHPPTL